MGPGPIVRLIVAPTLSTTSRRQRLLSVACVLVIGLAACNALNVAPGDKDYPQPNPHPLHFLFLHGTIDKSLDLNFRVEWHSDIAKCRYAVSRTAGVYSWHTAFTVLDIARVGDDFTARIPIDGVLPGRCRWTFGGVTYGPVTGYRSDLIAANSYPLRPRQSANGIVVLHCKWLTINSPGFTNPNLECHQSNKVDANSAVIGGTLWWHPEATDLEAHFFAD